MIRTCGERPLAMLRSVAARMDQLIAARHGGKDPSVWASTRCHA